MPGPEYFDIPGGIDPAMQRLYLNSLLDAQKLQYTRGLQEQDAADKSWSQVWHSALAPVADFSSYWFKSLLDQQRQEAINARQSQAEMARLQYAAEQDRMKQALADRQQQNLGRSMSALVSEFNPSTIPGPAYDIFKVNPPQAPEGGGYNWQSSFGGGFEPTSTPDPTATPTKQYVGTGTLGERQVPGAMDLNEAARRLQQRNPELFATAIGGLSKPGSGETMAGILKQMLTPRDKYADAKEQADLWGKLIKNQQEQLDLATKTRTQEDDVRMAKLKADELAMKNQLEMLKLGAVTSGELPGAQATRIGLGLEQPIVAEPKSRPSAYVQDELLAQAQRGEPQDITKAIKAAEQKYGNMAYQRTLANQAALRETPIVQSNLSGRAFRPDGTAITTGTVGDAINEHALIFHDADAIKGFQAVHEIDRMVSRVQHLGEKLLYAGGNSKLGQYFASGGNWLTLKASPDPEVQLLDAEMQMLAQKMTVAIQGSRPSDADWKINAAFAGRQWTTLESFKLRMKELADWQQDKLRRIVGEGATDAEGRAVQAPAKTPPPGFKKVSP